MNKITLIGRLTADPELRSTQNGTAVCTFTIAVDRRFSGQNGERAADFIPVVVWRGLAETCGKYLAKGKKAAVCGSLQTRKYEDKQGNKRTAFEVIADDVEFLTPREQLQQETNTEGFAQMDEADLPF